MTTPARSLLRALAAAAGLLLLATGSASAQTAPSGAPTAGIEARGSIVPRESLFGDTIEARIDTTLDPRRIDPDSVRVTADFLPWELAGKPERTRRDAGSTTHLRTTYRIRCLISPCLASNQSISTNFPPARVSFLQAGASPADREAMDVPWPRALVYSRFASTLAEDSDDSPVWRADLVSMPAVSYRLPPGLLLAVLVAAAAMLVLAGGLLVYVAWPRRLPVEEPEPEPEPGPVLSPLEQALLLLEDEARANGAADQRRALELVADELEEQGEQSIAGAARTLAWSEDAPGVHETSALAARVREAIRLEEPAEEDEVDATSR